MRFLLGAVISSWLWLVLATGVAAEASSQLPSTIDVLASMPECAQPCVLSAVANSTCSPTDQACVCQNESLQAAASECVKHECSVRDGLLTKNITATSCQHPVRDKGPSYVVLSDTLGIFIAISVFQRVVAKAWWGAGLAADDWCILVTTITLVVPSLAINVHGLVANGMGRDVWTLAPDEITRFSTFFHVMAVLYFSQISMIKLTLLFFYLRVFNMPGRHRWILYGTIAVNCVYGLLYDLITVFQCMPVGYLSVRWDHEHEGRCLNINALTWSNACISIAMDVWMLVIPILQVHALQLDLRKKIGAALMFCVGTAFTVISIVRLHVLVTFNFDENPTWVYLEICKWSTIEIAVGVICSCMPSYRVLLMRFFPRIFGSTRRGFSNTAGSYLKSGHGSFAPPPHKGATRSHVATANGSDGSDVEAGSRSNVDDDSKGIMCSRSYSINYGEASDDDVREQANGMPMADLSKTDMTRMR